MKIDHIGYAVKKIDRAVADFEKLGYRFEPLIEDADRNVAIVFGSKDGYRIELVSPLNKKEESPVDSYLGKVGSAPYHICYVSENLEADMVYLSQQGFRTVIPPAKAVAFGGKKVVFMMSLGMGLLELVQA